MTDWDNLSAPKNQVEYELVWEQWVASRPPAVQEKARAYPPGKYLMKKSGYIARLWCYDEDNNGKCETCKVLIYFDDNPGKCRVQKIMFPNTAYYQVFRVKFKDLELLERFTGNPAI
jgi:hypothetical protein